MVSPPRLIGPSPPHVDARNRRTVRVLLAIVSVLVVATLLAGIRW